MAVKLHAMTCGRLTGRLKDMIEGDDEHAGRDFHYTRCGHGCGYWDGHWDQHGYKLTELARRYGTLELYGSVNDDGEVTSAYLSH